MRRRDLGTKSINTAIFQDVTFELLESNSSSFDI